MAGPLKNRRHERFAQELAKGRPQLDAHKAAGFSGDKSRACAMAKSPLVAARVAELLERAAARTEITVAGITKRLIAIADKAEQAANGVSGLGVSRQTLMDIAKLNGLVIDKTQRELSEEQMKAVLALVAANPGMAEQLLDKLT